LLLQVIDHFDTHRRRRPGGIFLILVFPLSKKIDNKIVNIIKVAKNSENGYTIMFVSFADASFHAKTTCLCILGKKKNDLGLQEAIF
jgi:hypothetical protein